MVGIKPAGSDAIPLEAKFLGLSLNGEQVICSQGYRPDTVGRHLALKDHVSAEDDPEMSATFPFRGRLGQQEELRLPLIATRGECSKVGIWQ